MKTYVLYHDNCNDGFGAAWASWLTLGDEDVTYVPVQYGRPLPEIRDGSTVYIVDFSYDRETLIALSQRSKRVTVLDHHRTAKEALTGLDGTNNNLSITFDMAKSGAVLAWEHFHPGEPLPLLLAYVQDRDLWTWKLPSSREFSAALSLEAREFGRWSDLETSLSDDSLYCDALTRFTAKGTVILEYQAGLVAGLAAKAHLARVGGHEVPAVNSPLFQSELGEELCKMHPDSPFAAVYFKLNPAEEVWSLRSRGGFDVSAVARQLGGGGHPAAAGFKVTTP